MTTTLAELIAITRDYVYAGAPERRNKLTSGIDASETELTFTYGLGPIQTESKISIGLEEFHVWSVEESPRTAEVDRGMYGTTATSHSAGDIVLVNPRYSDARIVRALNAAVSELVSEGIYQVSSVNLTTASATGGYDMTGVTDFLGVLNAHWESIMVPDLWYRLERARVQTDADPTSFPSGIAFFPKEFIEHGRTLRVQYRHELSASLAALDDVVETVVGVESDALDLLALGAARHLVAGREVNRNETDVQRARRDEDVPAGAWTQAPSGLRQLYRDRLKAERVRLSRKYPVYLRTR